MSPFDSLDLSSIGKFSIKNARALSLLSELVYEDESEVLSKGELWGFSVHFFSMKGTEGALFARKDLSYGVLAFRGTSSLDDAFTDADFILEPGPLGGRVHSGFNGSFDDVWEIIAPLIECFSNPSLGEMRLLLTGHSLGAGIASVALGRFLEMGLRPLYVYTFGSPRVGDAFYSNMIKILFAGRFFRVENNNDVVCRILPWLFFYRHIGERVYISFSRRVIINPSMLRLFLDRLIGRILDIGILGPDGAKDHRMSEYKKAMEL